MQDYVTLHTSNWKHDDKKILLNSKNKSLIISLNANPLFTNSIWH